MHDIDRTQLEYGHEAGPFQHEEFEFNEFEYRFNDVIDLDTREVLFTVEHEVRAQSHPMFARPLINRNPAQSNRDYKPGQDTISWAMS